MDTTVLISPVGFFPYTATYIQINDVYVDINAQTANVQVTFLDSGRAPISASAQRYSLNSDAYAGWGSSDRYLVNCVLSGLGLNPVSGFLP